MFDDDDDDDDNDGGEDAGDPRRSVNITDQTLPLSTDEAWRNAEEEVGDVEGKEEEEEEQEGKEEKGAVEREDRSTR